MVSRTVKNVARMEHDQNTLVVVRIGKLQKGLEHGKRNIYFIAVMHRFLDR